MDLRTLVRRRGPLLDRVWVRERVVEMLGADDERITSWDAICANADGDA